MMVANKFLGKLLRLAHSDFPKYCLLVLMVGAIDYLICLYIVQKFI
ncbi:hypothetical protein DR64_1618 [Paraburkholderia xenovorans LB400]|jgi:hypothetical protein|nr:hypothetical protein DR64_1618 [Paraburkholderia xenovorans LB400]